VPSFLHVGQRLLHFEILLNDQIQLTGLRGVNDNMPIRKVVIRFKHVDEELDSISTKTLTLSRSEVTNSWSLDQEEIDRLNNLLQQR